MDSRKFEKRAKEIVCEYLSNMVCEPRPEDIFIVWSCKTLQNNKAILSSGYAGSPLFEITYSGDRKEFYLDAYQKIINKCIKDEDIERNRTILKIQIKEKSDMELKETVEMMLSEDYKERFKAEYWQTKIRYERLHNICVKAQAGTLDFELTCPLQLLDHQCSCMGGYLRDLEVRAEIEGISLQ